MATAHALTMKRNLRSERMKLNPVTAVFRLTVTNTRRKRILDGSFNEKQFAMAQL